MRKSHITWQLLLLVVLVVLVAGHAYAETSFQISTGNDILSGNRQDDDLYTAALGFTIELDRLEIELDERMFTDRDAGQRFDETWLLFRYRPDFGRRLELELEAGIVHVGRGLFGEDAQNLIHRTIGSDEVDLDYVSRQSDHGVLGAKVRRDLLIREDLVVDAAAEAKVAVGFQHWGRIELRAHWRPVRFLDVFASLGVRAGSSEHELLDPWIESVAPTAEIGVGVLERLYLSYSQNRYGTDNGHFHLGYRVRLPGLGRGR